MIKFVSRVQLQRPCITQAGASKSIFKKVPMFKTKKPSRQGYYFT